MVIYLIRHGEAENKIPGKSDSERPLTEEGKKKFAEAVSKWKNFIPDLGLLISSPSLRAYQTAEIVKKVYGIDRDIIKDNRLKPGSSVKNIIELVNDINEETISLFGHEPDFSENISSLVSTSGANINVKKGAIAKISFPGKIRPGSGILDFLVHPGVFLTP